jgi:hypothetical protein
MQRSLSFEDKPLTSISGGGGGGGADTSVRAGTAVETGTPRSAMKHPSSPLHTVQRRRQTSGEESGGVQYEQIVRGGGGEDSRGVHGEQMGRGGGADGLSQIGDGDLGAARPISKVVVGGGGGGGVHSGVGKSHVDTSTRGRGVASERVDVASTTNQSETLLAGDNAPHANRLHEDELRHAELNPEPQTANLKP